jgi:hypothetical protein
MKIIDNFLSEDDYYKLESTMTRKITWQPSTILNNGNFALNRILNIQFCHRFVSVYTERDEGVLIKHEVRKSEYFDIIEPILDKIEYSKIIRIKANLNVGSLNPKPTGFHVDNSDNRGLTGIYYVNTCNGYTLFKDGTKVDSVANRILIFDNQLEHSGVTCSDNRYRIVINFNWLP